MSSMNVPLFRLAQFYKSAVEPLRGRPHQAALPYQAAYARGNRLEAWCWLHFGVDLGYFPREQARQIVTQFTDVFFADLESFMSDYGDLPAPQIGVLWREAARTKDVFPALIGREISSPERLIARFGAVWLSSIRFAKESGNSLLPAVSFANRQKWEELTRGEASPDEVARLFQSGEKPDGANALCADFFEVLQHMSDMTALLATAGSGSGSAEDDRLFEERVGMILRWRLNLWQHIVQDRFLEIANIADRLLREEFQAREWAVAANLKQDAFLAHVRDLMRDWKARGGPQWQAAVA